MGAPPATEAEIASTASRSPSGRSWSATGSRGWRGSSRSGTSAAALAFTNRVGEIAEEEGHHPALLTEWGRVTVTWWTHKIRNLHVNDFVMAAKTDRAHAGGGGAR